MSRSILRHLARVLGKACPDLTRSPRVTRAWWTDVNLRPAKAIIPVTDRSCLSWDFLAGLGDGPDRSFLTRAARSCFFCLPSHESPRRHAQSGSLRRATHQSTALARVPSPLAKPETGEPLQSTTVCSRDSFPASSGSSPPIKPRSPQHEALPYWFRSWCRTASVGERRRKHHDLGLQSRSCRNWRKRKDSSSDRARPPT